MDTPTEARDSARARLGPDDWVKAGMAAFLSEGPGGLRVEALARAIGATKGSFYWHFKDVAALKAAVLSRIEAGLAEQAAVNAPNPRRRVVLLLSLPETPEAMGLRDWARSDAAAAEAVDRLDQKWLRAMEAALVANDLEPDHAPSRARLMLAARVGFGRLGDLGQTRAAAEADLRLLMRLVPNRKP